MDQQDDTRSRGSRGRLALLLYGSAAAAFLVDRVTKAIVERTLAGRPPIEVIPKVLFLRFTENSGGAFSLFGGAPALFLVATAAAAVAIAVASRHLPGRATAVGLGLILGGALGNLTDRLIRGTGIDGRVVDFIDFRVWPVFNAADTAIVVGAALAILGSLRARR